MYDKVQKGSLRQSIIKTAGYLLCVLSSVSLSACRRCTTLEEQQMAYETMVETSPRNLNEQPKAIPEFKFHFGGPPKTPDCRDIELEQTDRDIFIEKS